MADRTQKVNGERLRTPMKVQGLGRYRRRQKLHSREDMMQKITDMLSLTSIDNSRGELQSSIDNSRATDENHNPYAVPRCNSEPPQGMDLVKDKSFVGVENEQICEVDMTAEQMSMETDPK